MYNCILLPEGCVSIWIGFGWSGCFYFRADQAFPFWLANQKPWLPQAGTAAKDAKWIEGLGSEIPNKCRRKKHEIHFCLSRRNLLSASFGMRSKRQKRISVARRETCSGKWRRISVIRRETCSQIVRGPKSFSFIKSKRNLRDFLKIDSQCHKIAIPTAS